MAILHTEELSIHFGGLVAVDKLNCTVDNEVLGLIGPNGSGKTTFLNLVSGIYQASGGEIYFYDKKISGKKAHTLRKIGIARTFQTNRLCLHLTVLDNMMLGLFPHQKTRWWEAILKNKQHLAELKKNVHTCLAVLEHFNEELVSRKDELIETIPLIDRRRIEIARALVSQPKLLLLDEPTAGLNPEETRSIVNDIQKIRETRKDIGIIFIEHDTSVISTIADRIIVLNAGKIIAEGTFDEISNNKEVQTAYLGS